MKCNRDSGLPYTVIVSFISSAKLEWISVSSSLPYNPQGRHEFQDLLDMWKYLSCAAMSRVQIEIKDLLNLPNLNFIFPIFIFRFPQRLLQIQHASILLTNITYIYYVSECSTDALKSHIYLEENIQIEHTMCLKLHYFMK